MRETMVTLVQMGSNYVYDGYTVANIGGRWYVSNGIAIVRDFATLDEVRSWLWWETV